MTAGGARVRTPRSAATEPLLAFLAAVAFFLVAAAATPLRHHVLAVVLWGAVCLVAIVWLAKRLGPLYGVPLAIAAGLAFDSFYIPPTRPFGGGAWQNWLVVAIYLALGVLIGVLGARSQRAAEASERARASIADEQAALRRVATLVANECAPREVFAAVTEEVGRLLDVDDTRLIRYERGDIASVVAAWGTALDPNAVPAEMDLPLEGDNIAARVARTGRAARVDDYASATGPLAELGRSRHGIRSAVGTPIVADGRLWGVMVCTSRRPQALPDDVEVRVAQFTELAATAISNIEARTELAASRARIVAAADAERLRVVRDLHDGAQQRLVHTIVTLKLARRAMASADDCAPQSVATEDTAPALVDEALEQAERAMVELRELVHGILPYSLTSGGLRDGVDDLASRMPMPVDIGVEVPRLPAQIEATAYFVVAEALTNVAKHAHANHAEVHARIESGKLQLQVRDDGSGGARADGNGLVGLADRLAVVDGRLRVESTPGSGTVLSATIPLPVPTSP